MPYTNNCPPLEWERPGHTITGGIALAAAVAEELMRNGITVTMVTGNTLPSIHTDMSAQELSDYFHADVRSMWVPHLGADSHHVEIRLGTYDVTIFGGRK